MYSLGHIQPAIEDVEDYKFFTTITLPKCHYRKGPTKQFEVAKALFKRICENYFDSAYGCTELTKKGNIHIHAIVSVKTELSSLFTETALARMMSAYLKPYSNCDFQVIKCIDNVYTYVYKDIAVMQKVLEKSPCISWELKPSKIDNKLLKSITCIHNVPCMQRCKQCALKYGTDIDNEIYN